MPELNHEQKLENLELLVDELMREKPQETVVKQRMEQSGLQYTTDPIERIHCVLKALHFVDGSSDFEESKQDG